MQINPAALTVIRERTGLSVTELGRRSGVDRSHLSLIESGTRQASEATIVALARALKVDITAIISAPAEATS